MVSIELQRYVRAGIFGLLLVCAQLPVYAHEPLFGVGPHTVYQNGLGLEAEIELEDEGIARSTTRPSTVLRLTWP